MSAQKIRFHVFPIGEGFTFEAVDDKGEACAFGEPCSTQQEACEKIMRLHPFGGPSIEFSEPPGGARDVTVAMNIASRQMDAARAA